MSLGDADEIEVPVSANRPDGNSLAALLRSPLFWVGLIAVGLACLVYYPLFFPPSLHELAVQSEEFFFEANEAAGAPVLILSAWLLFRRSHYRDLLRGAGAPATGMTVLALTAALYAWGFYTGAPDLQLASVIGLLFGAALCLGGIPAVRAFWVPILFLGFALPLPPVALSAAMFPIQLVTAEYAGVILNSIGVASYVQGDQILRPENTFIVIETCSGVRTIVTLTMLTVLLIDLFERRGWHAAILFMAAPIVAFLTNGVRVVTLVLNPHSSIHSIHNLQGIVMLLVGLTGIYFLDLGLERAFGSDDQQAEPETQSGFVASVGSLSGRLSRLLAIALILVTMLAASLFIPPWKTITGLTEMPEALLSRVFGESRTRAVAPDYQFRGSARYLAHATRRMRVDGESMEIFLGIGNEQVRSHTLLTPRLAWPESGYAPVDESTLQLGEGGPTVRRVVLRQGARSLLSYSWYERNGSFLVEWLRNALAIDRSPFVRDEHVLALRISTPLGPGGTDEEAADARIAEVWHQLRPELDGYAPTRPID